MLHVLFCVRLLFCVACDIRCGVSLFCVGLAITSLWLVYSCVPTIQDRGPALCGAAKVRAKQTKFDSFFVPVGVAFLFKAGDRPYRGPGCYEWTHS
jgi:hypothetical protein